MCIGFIVYVLIHTLGQLLVQLTALLSCHNCNSVLAADDDDDDSTPTGVCLRAQVKAFQDFSVLKTAIMHMLQV